MAQSTRDTSHSIVRWIFQRGTQLLTCSVDGDANGTLFMASVVPHQQPQLAALVTFETGISAMQYHARTADRLRQLGWTIVSYTSGQAHQAAA